MTLTLVRAGPTVWAQEACAEWGRSGWTEYLGVGLADGSGHLVVRKLISRWGHGIDRGMGRGVQGRLESSGSGQSEVQTLTH